MIEELNAWLEANGFFASAEPSDDGEFWYNTRNSIIRYGSFEQDAHWQENENDWISFCERLGGFPANVPIWVQAFLHELGHSETFDDFTDEEISDDLCNRHTINFISDIHKQRQAYYNLPTERIATQWAIDYAKRNFNAVKELISICKTKKVVDA